MQMQMRSILGPTRTSRSGVHARGHRSSAPVGTRRSPWLPGDAAFACFLAGSSLVRAPPACCAWSKGVRRAQARAGRRRSGHGARIPIAPLRRSVCMPVISHPASTVTVGVPRQFRAANLPQLPTLATPYIRAADAWQMPDASLLVCIQTALLRSSRAPSERVGASDVRSMRRAWTLISLSGLACFGRPVLPLLRSSNPGYIRVSDERCDTILAL
jgi:hypothetical protein